MYSKYAGNLLDDIYHLRKIHGDQFREIKKELINNKGLCECISVRECLQSLRHYDDDRRSIRRTGIISTAVSSDHIEAKYDDDDEEESKRYEFYQDILDSVHFSIFHLYEIGLRIELKNNETVGDNNNIDFNFDQLKDIISSKKKEYDKTFQRFSSSTINNKYNIGEQFQNVSYNEQSPDQSSSSSATNTWIDNIINKLHENGIPNSIINRLYQHIIDEEYDTDSLFEDLDFEDKGNSNIYQAITDDTTLQSIADFIRYSKCMCFNKLVRSSSHQTFN